MRSRGGREGAGLFVAGVCWDQTNSLSFDEGGAQARDPRHDPAAHSEDYRITPVAAAGLNGLDCGLTSGLSCMLNVSAKVSSALSAGRVTRGRLWRDAGGEGEREQGKRREEGNKEGGREAEGGVGGLESD